jgi:hypothetical protein
MFRTIHRKNRDYIIALNYTSNLEEIRYLKIEGNLLIKKLQGTVIFSVEVIFFLI